MALQIGIGLYPALIGAGQALSAEVDLGAQTLVGILMPTVWTAAVLTMEISPDGGVTWAEHYNAAGIETAFTVAAGQYVAIDPTLWRGANAIKLRSGTAASPVLQTAGAVLQVVARCVT